MRTWPGQGLEGGTLPALGLCWVPGCSQGTPCARRLGRSRVAVGFSTLAPSLTG